MKILEANTHKEFALDQISHTADINADTMQNRSLSHRSWRLRSARLAEGAEGARYRLIREIVTTHGWCRKHRRLPVLK